MPRILPAAASILALGLTSIVAAQHGPAKVAAQDSVPAKKIMPAAPSATRAAAAKEAERPMLRIGDRAPQPMLAEILKGDTDFKTFPKGKVTVMEFWATWCGPCKSGMPHLSELQAEYADRGVTIIGVTREEPGVVKTFLGKPEWDAKTRYTMALDQDSKTNEAYMKAARRSGIPCAFVVDQKGRVAWIGHPMSMDEPLAKIVAEDWDIKEARTEFERAAKAQQMMRAISTSLREARRTGDYNDAMRQINKGIELMPGDSSLQMMKFETMIGPIGDPTGYDLGWDLFKANKGNAMMLNRIAWYVLDDDAVKDRNLDFALLVAKAANDAAGGSDAAILDTLARAYFELGEFDTAIRYQKKAIERAEGGMTTELESTLDQYEAAAKNRSA
jgi:thiol-disulfide isomerase/thioredoxin